MSATAPASQVPSIPSTRLQFWIGAIAPAVLGWALATPLAAQPLRPDRPDFFEQGQAQLEAEIRNLEQRQPQTTPILTVETNAPQWSPVLVRDGGFVIWMPQGAMTQTTQAVETSAGALDFEVISSRSRLGHFVVAFSPAGIVNDDPEAILERVQNRISGWQTGFGLQDDESSVVSGAPARDFTLSNGEETMFFRLLLLGDRLYVIALNQPTETVSLETRTAFFNSFQPL